MKIDLGQECDFTRMTKPFEVTIIGSKKVDVRKIDPKPLRLLSQGVVATVVPGAKSGTIYL